MSVARFRAGPDPVARPVLKMAGESIGLLPNYTFKLRECMSGTSYRLVGLATVSSVRVYVVGSDRCCKRIHDPGSSAHSRDPTGGRLPSRRLRIRLRSNLKYSASVVSTPDGGSAGEIPGGVKD